MFIAEKTVKMRRMFTPSGCRNEVVENLGTTLDGVIHTAPRDSCHQPQLRHGKLLNPQRIRL